MRFHRVFYRILSVILRFLLRLLCRIEVRGGEHAPASGPVIVAVNHLNFLDPPLVLFGVHYKFITVLIAEKWADLWPINWFARGIGGIFVQRGEVDRQALNGCLEVLQAGGVIGLAPEGTRSRTGVMQRAKPGVAYLATKANVPVLPIGISGSESIVAEWRRLRRPHILVAVGEPILLARIEGKHKTAQLQARSDEVMCAIAALVRDDLRGVYTKDVCGAEFSA